MTDARDLDDDGDALAAEYALGLLVGDALAEAESREREDPAFRAAVAFWSGQFAALADDAAAVDPPLRVRGAIERRLFPPAADEARPTTLWPALERLRVLVFGALAGAVALAALMLVLVNVLQPPPPALQATIAGATDDLAVRAVYDAEGERLVVTRVAGAPAPAGQAHELWLLAPEAAPVSLGLIGEGDLAVTYPEPPEGWTLAVSLEPEGGSATGAPTGPVLATGQLTRL